MMKTITSKAEVKNLFDPILDNYSDLNTDTFIKEIHVSLLKQKIKFPILEFAAQEIYKTVPEKKQILITDGIMQLHEIGGNTITGMILQLRLSKYFNQSIHKAIEYIILGNQWYVCDIIGERVMGYALLTQAEKTIPVLKELAKHENKWIVRSIGVASHYAIKKGLKKIHVEEMFQVLFSLSTATDFHTKKGIGWAAKTIAKFHPEIIAKHKIKIDTDDNIKQWFKTKIKIGLSRSFKYASKYSG